MHVGDQVAQIASNGVVEAVVYVMNPELPLEAFARSGGSALAWPDGAPWPAYVKDGQVLALPNAPSSLHVWDNTLETWVDPRPLQERVEELHRAIKAERDKRLSSDFVFQGVLYQRDQVSLSRITGAATLAGFAVGAGIQPGDFRWHGGTTDFAWIAADNSLTLMDAQMCFAFGQAAAAVETGIVFAAKALREMDPIPENFTDDGYWP